MNIIVNEIEKETLRKDKLDFRVGDSVKVHNLIREGEKERIQIYEGIVLKRQGGGNRETFTVRKNSNGVGVEKTFPVNSPMVVKVEVVRHGKARRAKLNYLRDKVGKAAKVKESLSGKTTINKNDEIVENIAENIPSTITENNVENTEA